MAGAGDGRWETGREIEAGLSPPSAADDPDGVFGEGLVVDCVSRVGVLAMPADLPVGLNLQFKGSTHLRMKTDGSDTVEFAPSAVTLLKTYLAAHPDIVHAVVRSAHRRDQGAVGGSSRFAVGKFIRGISPAAANAAREWRERNLPKELLASDTTHETRSPVSSVASGKTNSRTRRLECRAAGANAASGDATSEKQKQKPEKPAVILVPALPPAVPAWNVPSASTAVPESRGTMADILAEESKNKSLDAAPRAVRMRDGMVSRAPKNSGGGSFADLLRGGSSKAGGSPAWAVQPSSFDRFDTPSLQTPAPPSLPKITPESLHREARRSKIDGFGKIKCQVCGRMFKSYGPLEQHLAASHFGLNSSQAKALEAALIASGQMLPGDGSQKTKPERLSLQFSQILEQPWGGGGNGVASLAASLSAYIREAKPSKANRRLAAAAKQSGPKGKGKLVVNPNQAMSSGMVMRRGKEREGPKKKKRPTKLKRIILTARAARAEEEDLRNKKTEEEVEVTVEVGRVYVNLLFDSVEGSDGRVGVDLIYLEDEDEEGDESGEEETDEKGETTEEGEAIGAKEVVAPVADEAKETATDTVSDEVSVSEAEIVPEEKVPDSSPSDPPLSTVTVPTNPWAIAGGFKDALLRAETLVAKYAAMASCDDGDVSTAKPKKKKKKTRDPSDGPREKGVARVCEVCNITCSGDDAWADHLKGKGHAKAERRVEHDREEQNGNRVSNGQSATGEKKKNANTFVGADDIRYADQIISAATNAATISCVSELKRFQDRAYFKDAVKAKMRRRLVFGLREVAKAVQLKKAKAVVVAPNIEEVVDEGGLDDVVGNIITAARLNGTPIVFALTRNKLGQIVGKRMRISALAILDHDGAYEQFKDMIASATAGRTAFKDEQEKKAAEAELLLAEDAENGDSGGNLGLEDPSALNQSDEPTLNPAAATFVPRYTVAS